MQLYGFLSKKISQKKTNKRERIQERVTPGWTDISGEGPVGFLIQKFHVLQYANLRNTLNC